MTILGQVYYFNIVQDRFDIEIAPRQENPNLNRIVLIGKGVFAKRGYFKRQLDSCVRKQPVNYLQDLLLALKHQQGVVERVNIVT